MNDNIDFHGMNRVWFPLSKILRRVLETVDPIVPTGKASTSPTMYNLMQRDWVSFEGYEPTAGRIGQKMYLRTPRGEQALEIDERIRATLHDKPF